MDTKSPSESTITVPRFDKYESDLKELEEMRIKASKAKPKKHSDPLSFLRFLLSASLFILIFLASFYIAYKKTEKEKEKDADFKPEAEFKIPQNFSAPLIFQIEEEI